VCRTTTLLPGAKFRDFAPVQLVGTAPYLLSTPVSRPFKTLADVIAAAKSKSDTLTDQSSPPSAFPLRPLRIKASSASGQTSDGQSWTPIPRSGGQYCTLKHRMITCRHKRCRWRPRWESESFFGAPWASGACRGMATSLINNMSAKLVLDRAQNRPFDPQRAPRSERTKAERRP
jgi:hypothetical protein